MYSKHVPSPSLHLSLPSRCVELLSGDGEESEEGKETETPVTTQSIKLWIEGRETGH